ncbi:MAG: hypothetical protein L0177_08355 [Chloroflexi bacterium]|nr:hypothetical protein [Chloroflexota bacterium]
MEESGDLFHTLETRGLALVRLVAPTTATTPFASARSTARC